MEALTANNCAPDIPPLPHMRKADPVRPARTEITHSLLGMAHWEPHYLSPSSRQRPTRQAVASTNLRLLNVAVLHETHKTKNGSILVFINICSFSGRWVTSLSLLFSIFFSRFSRKIDLSTLPSSLLFRSSSSRILFPPHSLFPISRLTPCKPGCRMFSVSVLFIPFNKDNQLSAFFCYLFFLSYT